MARNRYYKGPLSDHFDGTRFFMRDAPPDKTFGELFRALRRTPMGPWPAHVDNPPAATIVPRVEGAALRVTTIGHASHLIQTRGLNLLIDPVWSERASPFGAVGPKRVASPGFALAALPQLDAILITHNHYDHLDMPTLKLLRTQRPCRIIAPLGNDTIIRRGDRRFAVEAYDWGETVVLSPHIKVTLVPCHHWSARWIGDRRMALWAAFVIETPDRPIYHVGDTAWRDGRLFRGVFETYGAPRLAILPIGAYAPRWFMRDHHVDPAEAVQIFEACRAHHALAHHWGTFRLTAESWDDPLRRLAAALADACIAPDRFRVQRPGAAFDVPLA